MNILYILKKNIDKLINKKQFKLNISLYNL
jgi:hypothetical protein